MSRRSFIIWFVAFVIIQWPMMSYYPLIRSLLELLAWMFFWALTFSSLFGIIWAGLICCQDVPNVWNYLFNEDKWLNMYSHGVGKPDFSFERMFWLHDVLPVVLAFVIILHLYLCARRCKDAGLSVWWILVPLYNPFVLMFKKGIG